jgi:hypothetical protein
MRSSLAAIFALAALASTAHAADKMRFWNLTANTITELRLAPAGTGKFGPNQCDNDPDKSVDADERLTLADVTPGIYDVALKDKTGRSCSVPNVEVKGGTAYAFSIEEEQLKKCKK